MSFVLGVIMWLFLMAKEASRNYFPVAIRDITSENPIKWRKLHTHIEVTGWITYLAKEADGDEHMRICDSPKVVGMDRAACIVAECIPKLPCKPPKIGSKVTVRGIYRYDAEQCQTGQHCWHEVHPVEELVVN